LSTPASVCFSTAKDVLEPRLVAGRFADFGLAVCALAEPVKTIPAAALMAAAPRKRRRSWSMGSMFISGKKRTLR
jgi:hypothetical protein